MKTINKTQDEALEAFLNLSPSKKDFEALGLPFEAFQRWCQVSEAAQRKAAIALLERWGRL
jgi:hypothetical protein